MFALSYRTKLPEVLIVRGVSTARKKCRVIGLSVDDVVLLMDRSPRALCRICTINLFAESLITRSLDGE